jgi:amidase
MTSTNAQLAYLSLSEVASLIAKKDLSPVELTQGTLDRISALDSRLHSYYLLD